LKTKIGGRKRSNDDDSNEESSYDSMEYGDEMNDKEEQDYKNEKKGIKSQRRD
jgi:hypothetical protein